MKFFTKILIASNLFITFIFSGIENTETGWAYSQSTFQAFYMLESTQIDGSEIEATDVIGAFKDGICLGWVYGDSDGYTTIPVMGNDGSDYASGYLNANEIPDLFIYDSSYGSILNISPSSVLPGWSNNEIFIIDGTSSAANTFGCKDETACNYDASATADDGSCWSANDGCTCDDAQGSVADCLGVCNGTAVVDDCNVCDGGNADKDCAGVCFGDSLEDGCGVCDSDATNDNVTCTGCTDSCADNYDQANLFDDGSCDYSLDPVSNFVNEPGDCRVNLSWTASDLIDSCSSNLYYEIYNGDGLLVKELSNNSTQILDLEPEQEYCFYVVAKNDNATSANSDLKCAITGSECGGFIGMQLTTTIDGWGFIQESDSFNYLGFAGSATSDFDETYDIVEPPTSPDNWISLYFPHAEWASSLGNNFTQDIRTEDYDLLSSQLEIWEGKIVSNMSGNATLRFDFLDNFADAFESIPMYVEIDDEYYILNDETFLEFYLFQGVIKNFSVIIGNRTPQPVLNLNALGGDLSANLSWSPSDDCCQSEDGRYPAISYNIYFDTNESSINTLDSSYIKSLPAYETEYCFTITAVNEAGESDGNTVCSLTNDNLNPIANAGSDIYTIIEHDGDINTNTVSISLTGSGFDPEGYDISYEWNQVSGDIENFESNQSSLNLDVNNPFGNEVKVYVFELKVFDTYPKGNPAELVSRQSSDLVSVFVTAEQNNAPDNLNPIDLIELGDGLATYKIFDEDDGIDYDNETSYWVVPHDGSPTTNQANLVFKASNATDPDGDDLSFSWQATFEAEIYTDLNGDGEYSPIEPFEDTNGNGVWDSGEEFYEGEILNLRRTAGSYQVTLTATDVYGFSSSSTVIIGVQPEFNESPSAFAGADQEWFMPNLLDLFGITVNDNSGSDPDGDQILFSWNLDGYESQGNSNGGWLDLVESLPVGDHIFTFTATDSYGASASDDVLISILNEPASAAITNLSTEHGLYYVTVSFDEGVLEEDSRYTGDLDNSVGYDIFRDGELIATIDDEGGSSFSYLDNGIASSTTFNYDVQSFNSDERRGDAVSASETTGDRPTVEVLSPNGAEIWSVGDAYPVEITTTDKQYISDIEVFYSDDGGQNWLSSGSIDSDSESTTITSGGAGINYDALVKVVVTDVGDFNGDSKQSKEDASNNKFTLAAHTLSKNYWTGWHLFGAPLVPELQTMEDNLGILGNFGDNWLAYDQDGGFQNLELPLGQGFYLALSQDSNLQLSGDPVISSNLDQLADLDLQKGWTLASNPLVTIVDKNTLEVVYDGETKSYGDAVLAGWIAPHVIGWFEDTHYPSDHLVPWGGYWFHTSRPLTVKVRPHLPLESSARIADNSFSINLTAQPVDGLSGGDFVNMSVKDGANDSFKYGEDEFDHPNPAMSSFVDLYFNKDEWIGSTDENGIMVDNPYFARDVRSSEIDNHVWNISGKAYDVTGDINLSWSMSNIDQEAYLLVGDDAYDMREVSSITVSSIENMVVVMGDLQAYLAPSEFGLSASYPNPFNPTTSMNLSLNESGYVNVNVYNVMGQIVSTLVDGNMDAGYHTLTWNADNMPSGMYLIRVQSGSNIETQKVMLLK